LQTRSALDRVTPSPVHIREYDAVLTVSRGASPHFALTSQQRSNAGDDECLPVHGVRRTCILDANAAFRAAMPNAFTTTVVDAPGNDRTCSLHLSSEH